MSSKFSLTLYNVNMSAFWWLSFVILIEFSLGKSYYIHCDPCLESVAAASIQQCSVEVIRKEIYPEKNEATVHKPTWNNASWYTYQKSDNSTAIAFNMTWSHSGDKFLDKKGYVLSILRTSSNAPYMRKFIANLRDAVKPSDQVFINYPCFGKMPGEDIQPDYSYTLKLRSLPSYHEGSDHLTNEADEEIHIPACDDGDALVYQVQHCVDERYYSMQNDDEDDDDNEDDSSADSATTAKNPEPINNGFSMDDLKWIISIPLGVLIVIGIMIVLLKRKKTEENRGILKKSMVFLTSVTGAEGDDILYLETVDLLGALLRKYGNIEVDSVMWKTCSDYTDWIYDKTKSCDGIVLVCSPLGKSNSQKSNTNDPFTIGLHLLLKNHKKKLWNFQNSQKFYVIYFDDNESKCIPESLVSNKIKCYKLPKKLEWLFKNIAGMNLDSVPDKDAIVELKTNLKLINSDGKKTDRGYLKKECVKNDKSVNGEIALLPTDKQQIENSKKAADFISDCV